METDASTDPFRRIFADIESFAQPYTKIICELPTGNMSVGSQTSGIMQILGMMAILLNDFVNPYAFSPSNNPQTRLSQKGWYSGTCFLKRLGIFNVGELITQPRNTIITYLWLN